MAAVSVGQQDEAMVAVAPLCCFLLAMLAQSARHGPRDAFLRAAVLWGVLVAGSTDLLSLCHALDAPVLAAFWCGACAVGAVACWRRREALAIAMSRSRDWPSGWVVAAVLPVAAIVVVTALIAVVSPPNSWDSMNYEMARVAHWIDDGSVAHYPTTIVWQLLEPPWAEYAILHFQLLTGGDRLANLVEWFGMVGSVIGVSTVASELGAPGRGQVLAAVVGASLPEGILEATSTFNHYVLAFWLVCCALFALQFARFPATDTAACLGASAGLALLTHGTAYLYLLPLLLAVGLWACCRLRRAALGPALLVLAIAFTLNLGLFARNQLMFGGPLGPASNFARYANARFSPAVFASNVIRDAAIQFGTPNHRVNVWLTDEIGRAHTSYLGIDVNDRGTTQPGYTFQMPYLTAYEGLAGSPLQVLAIGLAGLAAVLLAVRPRGRGILVLYASCLLAGYFLFAFYLKWQPWHVRLELPLLVLGAPLCGATFAALGGRAPLAVLGGVLLVASWPWLVDNQTRPLINAPIPLILEGQQLLPPGETVLDAPRDDLYFVLRPELSRPYHRTARQLQALGCRDVAVWSDSGGWEYPLWALTDLPGRRVRFQQVFVDNASRSAGRFGFRPCALVSLDPVGRPASVDLDGRRFVLQSFSPQISLYRPLVTTRG